MTREEVNIVVNNHNYEIDKFIELDLPKLLKKEGFKVKDGIDGQSYKLVWYGGRI